MSSQENNTTQTTQTPPEQQPVPTTPPVESTTQAPTTTTTNKPELFENTTTFGEKTIKNVDIKQCIYTIIFSALAFLVFLVPFTFGNAGLTTALSHFGTDLFSTPEIMVEGFNALINNESTVSLLVTMLDLDSLLLFIILCFNIVASILLIILRLPILRKIFKIVSIIAGIVMIIIALFSIIHIVGIVASAFTGFDPNNANSMMTNLETTGLLFAVASFIISFMLIKWQFRWFDSLW